VCNELCKIDELFPPNGLWVEYYSVKDLRDIIIITNKKKRWVLYYKYLNVIVLKLIRKKYFII